MKATKGSPLENFFNKQAKNFILDEDGVTVVSQQIAKDSNFFKNVLEYVGADVKFSKARFDTIEEVIDSTILHELAHEWIKKGIAPKSMSLDSNTIPRRMFGMLTKASRRRKRDANLTKLWQKGVGKDTVDWQKSYWNLRS